MLQGYPRGKAAQIEYPLIGSEHPVASPENKIIGLIQHCYAVLGHSYMQLLSRAGHDAQNVAHLTDEVGMIFVPSGGGISYAPDEWTGWEHTHRGWKCSKTPLWDSWVKHPSRWLPTHTP
ncbi:MAG: M20/M25/M40 family metallo-hydrolase [Thermoprotei archaeon]